MKKAFCEPGNISFCPPISIVKVLVFDLVGGSFTVKRSDANGGDVSFSNYEQLSASFIDGSLHPGDIKTASAALIFEFLDKMANAVKSDGEAAKSAKGLKAFQKKLAKQKK